uniref:Tudor domain containing 15 n=1 Tax=Tetraodon nigroviridis TaxID=99883 RepID=H3C257_TETNG
SSRKRRERKVPQSSAPAAPGPVELTLTHLDWDSETTLIHFQGKPPAVSELDYTILQSEIQRAPKAQAAVDIGDLCLVEDLASAQWYRGRVQNQKEDLFDVFLIDYGNVLSVGATNVSVCPDDLSGLLPKMVCGFLSNVLISQDCCMSEVEPYFSKLIGKTFTGHTRALLPYKVLILEIPEINSELVQHGFGRHVDTETFLFLVQMLTEIPPKRDKEPDLELLDKNPRGKDGFAQLSALQAYQDLSCHGPRLLCGTRARVRVTAAASTQLFYCQRCSADGDLSEISRKLAAVYEGGTEETKCHVRDNLGLLCAVKGKDRRWHRGFLPFLPDKSQIRVFFIDYGFLESVNVEDVQRLPRGLDSASLMAFACSLSEADQDVEAQQLSLLKSGLLGGVLDVEIRDFDEKKHLHTIRIHKAKVKDVRKVAAVPQTRLDSAARGPMSLNTYLYLETVLEETVVRTLATEDMRAGATFLGYVVYAQNPDRFWMRSQKRNRDFEDMMSKMDDHFREVKLDEDVLVDPQPGTLCCAMYEQDLHFYRALVVSQLLHGYKVLFIDFGNMEEVPHKLVKKIPGVLADAPAFAFCCSLESVLPLDDVWTTATCEVFRRTVSRAVLRAHVVQVRKSTFVVDLYELGPDAQSISEILVGRRRDGSLSSATAKLEEEKLTKRERCADVDLETQPVQMCAEQGQSTCKGDQSAPLPVCFKALNLKPGCQLAVCCSCVTSPSDFWCLPLETAQALAELMAGIQLYYSAHAVPLRAGETCCVVRSPEDGRWCRAVITDRQRDLCTLLLVDRGRSVHIQERHLQGILPEFLHLEAQAFWCSLSRLIAPADPVTSGGWSPVVCNLLKSLISDSCGLRCVVVSQWSVKNKELCHVVELHSSNLQPSLTGFLLERNLAREAAVSAQQMSSEFPESFVYSSFDLSPGSEEEVFVTHTVSQAELYCHLERNIHLIEKLETRISEETQRARGHSGAMVNNLCLAKYFDGQWYRGLGRPVQSPAHLSVYFVDYGNSMISEKSHLMRVPADAADLLFWPMQALRFSLASVPGEGPYADVSRWLSNTLLNRQVTARVVARRDDGSFDMELFDGDLNVNQKVTELINSLLPKAKNRPAARTQPDRRASASRASDKRGTRAGEKVLKKYKNSGRAPKEERRNPGEQQGPAHTSGARVQQPCVKKAAVPPLSSLPDVEVTQGLRAVCFVSHIDSLSRFFLQQAEDEPAVLKMAEDLSSDAFRDPLRRLSPTSLQIGDLVLAEYEEDGALYRSVVTHREGNSVKVEFVDYGNSSVMEDKIFSIPEEFLRQPRFSILCSLSDNHAYESAASFASAVMEKPLLVQFAHHPGPQWEVVIVEGAADPPDPPEAAEERKTDAENAPERSSGTDDQRNHVTETGAGIEAVETGEAPPTVDREKFTLAPPVYRSSKLKRVTCCCRRRTPNRFRRRCKRRSSLVEPEGGADDTASPLNIRAKDVENCTLLSVLSDGSFYVRLQRSVHLLSALERSISGALHRCELLPVEELTPGLKCLVQGPGDQRWHRAVVQRVFQQTCLVLLDDQVGELWKVEMMVSRLFLRPQPSLAAEEPMASQPQRLSFAAVDRDRAYHGFAAAVTNPFEFSVLLEDSLLILKKVSAVLGNLSTRLLPLPEAHLLPGCCCLLRSRSKIKWCRAEIVHSDSTVILNLLDYGLYECLARENAAQLRMLPLELRSLPKVIHPCILRGVKPLRADGQWSDEGEFFFQNCLYQKKLQIFFRESVSDTKWKVDMLADGVHVAKQLVDVRQAQYADVVQELR